MIYQRGRAGEARPALCLSGIAPRSPIDLCSSQRSMLECSFGYAKGPLGSVAGHAGPDDSQDAGCDGAAARVRGRAAHRTDQRGDAAAQRGDSVCVFAAAGAQGVDPVGMGGFGEQAQGAVLLADGGGAETAGARSQELGEDLGGHRTGAAAGEPAVKNFGRRGTNYAQDAFADLGSGSAA